MTNPTYRRLLWISRLRPAVGLLALVMTGVWAYTYSGLYAVFGDLQLWIFSAQLNVVTFALCFLVLIIVGILIVAPVERRLTHSFSEAALADLQKLQDASDPATDGILAVILCVGLTSPMLVAGWFAWNFVRPGMQAGPLTEFNAARFQKGDEPPSTFVQVRGVARFDQSMDFQRKGRTGSWPSVSYFPFVPLAASSQTPVRLLATGYGYTVGELERDGIGKGRREIVLKGMLSRDVDKLTRRSFLKQGVVLAPDVWLFDINETPQSLKDMGLAMIYACAALQSLIVGILLLLFKPWRKDA